MPTKTDAVNAALGDYRAYLETLTYIQIDPRLRSEFGLSDIIQQTLIEAWRDLERIQALDPEGRKRWLRRMLVNNLLDKIRRPPRPVKRSLEAAVAESSFRLEKWLAVEDGSPSDQLDEKERARRLLEALSELDPRQREVLILKKWHGWTLAQIAEHLGCTTGAVAGLHARGLKELRKMLPDME
jgi:RNA polymerase sigma-70 factor (ECF subfamily)